MKSIQFVIRSIIMLTLVLGFMTLRPATPARAADPMTFQITGKEFRFEPATITIGQGQPVVFIFHNKGRASHNLVIEALGLGTRTIYPDESDRISFSVARSGRYVYRCNIPGHTEAGMKGTLVVD